MIKPNSRVRVVKDIYLLTNTYVGKEGNAISRSFNGWWVTLDEGEEPVYFHDSELEPVSTKARRVYVGRVEQYDGPFGEPQIDGENVAAVILEYLGKNVRLTVEEVDG